MIRVAIVARSELEQAGLAALLRTGQDLQIVSASESLDTNEDYEVLVAATEFPLDESLLSLAGHTMVILLVADPEPSRIAQALRAGVRAVLPNRAGRIELAAAVRAVHAGWIVCPPDTITRALAPQLAPDLMPESLTPREIDVLRMIADGLSNKRIAYRLTISEHTVKFHVNSILSKLDAGSRTEAVMTGLRRGLIPL